MVWQPAEGGEAVSATEWSRVVDGDDGASAGSDAPKPDEVPEVPASTEVSASTEVPVGSDVSASTEVPDTETKDEVEEGSA
jgi:hypothetical protein